MVTSAWLTSVYPQILILPQHLPQIYKLPKKTFSSALSILYLLKKRNAIFPLCVFGVTYVVMWLDLNVKR